ncbi:MAG: hypothetical protein P8Z37_00170 [Acidobacteriota bacterium]|jgi:uncharacterized membrane protein YidH (DUF202 family)
MEDKTSDNIVINEIQLLLAEKRTSLSTLRTGITVFVLPLSVLGVLVATSKYYDFHRVLYLAIPLLVICAGLLALGAYLVYRAVVKIHRYDKEIQELKAEHPRIGRFIV